MTSDERAIADELVWRGPRPSDALRRALGWGWRRYDRALSGLRAAGRLVPQYGRRDPIALAAIDGVPQGAPAWWCGLDRERFDAEVASRVTAMSNSPQGRKVHAFAGGIIGRARDYESAVSR